MTGKREGTLGGPWQVPPYPATKKRGKTESMGAKALARTAGEARGSPFHLPGRERKHPHMFPGPHMAPPLQRGHSLGSWGQAGLGRVPEVLPALSPHGAKIQGRRRDCLTQPRLLPWFPLGSFLSPRIHASCLSRANRPLISPARHAGGWSFRVWCG